MSRVTRSTFRSAAASGLVLVTVGLAACGSDDPKTDASASTPAPAASTPAATTSPTSPKRAPVPPVIHSKVAVTKEGQDAIDAASDKQLTPDQVNAQAKDVASSLQAAGLKVKQAMGSQGGPVVLQAGSGTTVMVYPSEKYAARQAAGFSIVIDSSKTDGRIARDGNVMIATSAPKGMDAKLSKEFKQIRAAIAQV